MIGDVEFDVARLLAHPLFIRERIPPMVYRMAANQKAWKRGDRELEVLYRPDTRRAGEALRFRLLWDLGDVAGQGYPHVRDDLRKLDRTKNQEAITEQAAVGLAFALVSALLPDDQITNVVQKGGRGDFYLNGRRDEMIEISGTLRGNLETLFKEKRRQILLNRSLRRALVNVSRFVSPASRLERVR